RRAGEKLGLDVLSGDQELDRLDSGRPRGLDQVLALGREEAGLLPLPTRREELADKPQLRVVRRGDQAARVLASDSSAAFARSATSANAPGSDTARSASDLRSSSIPAFL